MSTINNSINNTLVAPILGTPTSGNLTSCTGLPIGTGVSGLGTGVATGLANNVTGSGSPVLATSPALVTPTLGAATATSVAFSPTTGGIIGTTAADNAGAGKVGEFVTSQILGGSAVSLTNNTALNVTSISLTAGDWEVFGNVTFLFGASTTITNRNVWVSTTSATLPDASLAAFNGASITGTPGNIGMATPYVRVNVSGTTTVYLGAYCSFATSTATACGGIFARRVR